MRNKLKQIKLNKVVSLMAFLGVSALSFNASAASVTGQASVNVVEPIDISVGGSQMSFGSVVRPSTGTETVIVSDEGDLSGTATRLGGFGSEGSFDISGAPGVVDINITDDANIQGLTLSDFTGTFDGQAAVNNRFNSVSLANGLNALSLGATLNIASDAPAGLQTPSYTVEVDYQ